MNNIKQKELYIYIYYYVLFFKKYNNIIVSKNQYNNVLKKNIIIIKKYYYIFWLLLYKILKNNFYNINKENKYFKTYNKHIINNFFLKYKDNILLIYLESYKNNIFIHNYKYNYFYKKQKINIILYKNLIFKIEIFIYLIYKDYIEFIKRYKYNEYLDENPIIYKYPLLKILLRNVDQSLLLMIKKKEKEFIRREDIIKNYDLYYVNIKKQKKKKIYLLNMKYIIISYKNDVYMKLLLLFFKGKFLYKNLPLKKLIKNIFLYIFWFRKITHYEITKVYNYFLDNYDWTKSDKLKSENIMDFLWQMHRYGFMLNYYYPLSLNYINFNFIKNTIKKIYNIFFLLKYSKKIKTNINLVNIFWYKIIKIISADYVKKYLFIFFFFHKFEILYKLYRHNRKKVIKKFNILYIQKSLNFKYIYLKFKDLINIINFKIYPINSEIYYKKENIIYFLSKKKRKFNNIYWHIFFFNNFYKNYYININFIIKKIFIDLENKNIFLYYINLYYKFIWKYNMEYIYMNIYHYLLYIKDFLAKSYIINSDNNNLIYIQKKQFLCFFKTYSGINLWYNFYNIYNQEWIWMYDFWLLFYMLRIYILDIYYIWYLLIKNIIENKSIKKISKNNY